MRQCRETCSCDPVPGKVAHRRAPQKSWSSHPLPTPAPTLAPPASSQKHLPTTAGPIASPSKKMPASHLTFPHLLQPGPLLLAAHQMQLHLGCGSTSVCLSPRFTPAACTCPAPRPARSAAQHPALITQVPPARSATTPPHALCTPGHAVCGHPPGHSRRTALLTSVHTRAGMASLWAESCQPVCSFQMWTEGLPPD